ncbi:MAG: YjbQ family protein [Kiritimatiellia bacterium]
MATVLCLPHELQPGDHGENADPRRGSTCTPYFDRPVPEDTPYFVHTVEGPDDMPSHIRMAPTADKSIPVIDGLADLGTAGLYLFEHRRAPHLRSGGGRGGSR